MMKTILPEYASEKLMLQLSQNQGAQPLVDLACELLDNPIAVGDTSLTVLFTSGAMPPQVPMSQPGMISPEFSTDTDFIKYNEEAYYNEMPVITPPQFGGYKTVLTRLKIHGQIAGYMSILLSNHPLRDGDIELVCLIRSAIEAELSKNKSVLSSPPKQFEYTLTQLLSGLANPLRNNADATISLGIDKNAVLYVIVFKMLGYSKANTPGLAIRRELSRLCGSKISVLYDGYIVVLRQGFLHQQNELTPPYPELGAYLKKYGIAGGISTHFNLIADIYKYYQQALAAMNCFIPQTGAGIYRYENAAVRNFFTEHEKYTHLIDYCHPGILRLKAYDDTNATHYVQVLKAYVENEKNALLTAQKTHLSKASVYRILERIKTITGQSFDSPEGLFNLYFSIKLLEYGQERNEFI